MERFPVEKVSQEEADKAKREGIEILYSYEQERYFIDEGGSGVVYKLPSGYCLKIIEDRSKSKKSDMYNLGNPPLVEARFQERMSKTEFLGKTRVPIYIGTIQSEVDRLRSAIIMERLDATNLQHIINGTADIPKSFLIHNFFEDLERFVQHMHDVEEIAHCDLYARNIMVDNETSEPRIIDFGRAVNLKKIESEVRQRQLMDHDFERLDEVFKALDALQNK